MVRGPTVSIRLVRAVLEISECRGVSRAALLRAAQLEGEQLKAAESRIPRSDFYAICELALDLSGDRALGLHGGEATTGGGHLIPYLMATPACLRQALETLAQIQCLVSDEPLFELVEGARSASVRLPVMGGAPARVSRFMAELTSVSLFRMIRRFARGALPQQVCFAFSAPPYRAEYTRVFGGVEHFERPFTGIVFERAVMDMISADSDQELFHALRAEAVQRAARHVQALDYSERVRSFLLRQERPTKLNMATVARGLGVSVRSLRRRLAAEGTTYNAIANAALAALAKRYLSVEQRTIQETAYLLGYTDSRAFHHAFKRWTGTTPSATVAPR